MPSWHTAYLIAYTFSSYFHCNLLSFLMFRNIFNKMELTMKSLGCEVRGVDLKTENRPESSIILLFYNHLLVIIVCII